MSAKSELLSLQKEFGGGDKSLPWDQVQAPVVRFVCANGIPGFVFHHLQAAYYLEEPEELTLFWAGGRVVIRGEKARQFYDEFANHKATMIRVGDGICSVEFFPAEKKGA